MTAMRLLSVLSWCLAIGVAAGQEPPATPLTPAEAAKKLEMKVTVELEVKSTGGRNNTYLNSHDDYRDAANFTIFIPQGVLPKFATAKIEKPVDFYKGKTIQVTGTVTLFEMKPQIRVEDPRQIKVIEKK